ncbi:MAG: transcription elongation factor Spt5 [Candidatus Hadarchaeota archaeon]
MPEEIEKPEEVQKPKVFAVRATVGQEKSTADMITARTKNFNLPIISILVPLGIKGYVFVETLGGKSSIERVRTGVKHAKGMVSGEVPITQLEQFLLPKPSVEGMGVGDIVEVTSGPFRGERARIIRIDEGKEEITVELFEATVPIPVTVRGDTVKVIQKKEK